MQSIVILAALNISAAFDTLDHTTLINRLEHTFGVSHCDGLIRMCRNARILLPLSSQNLTSQDVIWSAPRFFVGPRLFTLYVAPIANVISSFGVSHYQYAVDSQLYIAANRDNIQMKLDLLRDCTAAVNDLFLLNGLSLNLDKSEVLLLGTAAKLRTIGAVEQVSVAGVSINTTDSIKNLGVFLDSRLTFNKHVGKVRQSSYFHIMALKRIRESLSPEVANTVACAIVGAILDYFNLILYGTSKYNISRQQCVQITLARVVTMTKKFDHITPVLRRLHWLPIPCMIEYKVALLALKIRETGKPSYISHAVKFKEVTRTCRRVALG